MANKQKKIMSSGIEQWDESQLPLLSGKNIFITGGNSGLGLESSKMLASKGANIIFTSRSEKKALEAQKTIQACGSGSVHYFLLDLSDLNSVKSCAEKVQTKLSKIDVIINNAGIMMTPQTYTPNDHELQLATNHLGHFYLNSLLFDLIDKEEGRVVVMSSLVHKSGQIHFDNLMLKKSYSPMKAYAQSKLANLMYAFELNKRLKEKKSKIMCIACHPGYSDTNLQSTGPKGIMKFILGFIFKIFAQEAKKGALSTVLAAAGKEAKAGAYYGPQNKGEFTGPVGDAYVGLHALDEEKWSKLWKKSEDLVSHPFTIH